VKVNWVGLTLIVWVVWARAVSKLLEMAASTNATNPKKRLIFLTFVLSTHAGRTCPTFL
jgi:hypothetical protein